jgi:PTS system glucitol/sorbitol-specific IIA component
MTKYRAEIQSVGELAQEFVDEGILVFFATTAPEELQDTAFVHSTTEKPASPVVVGDQVSINGTAFPVLAVGPVANENLANLGHLVLKFNGLKEAEMPGDINLPEQPVPQLGPGSVVEISGA